MGLIARMRSAFSRKSALDSSVLERYLSWAFGGGASASGVIVNPSTAMQAGAVFACIKVLAESVGMLPCNLLTKKGDSSSLATDHPVYSLLHDQPNDWQSAVDFWEMVVLHMCLRGNAYAYINRDRSGRIVELLPQHPDSVKAEMLDSYQMRYSVRLENGSYEVITPGDMLHIRGLSVNGWLGISPIAYAREAIGLSLAAERFGGQLFKQGAKMGGVLEHPGHVSDDAYKRIKDSFDAAHSGENAHKTALLEEGMKFSKIAMTSEDAQFLETRKYQRSEIAAIFRTPPHMIGDLEKATFANIEQLSLEFVSYSLMPWLVRIEKAVKRDLLGPKDANTHTLKFNTFGLLRGDAKSRSDYYASGITTGCWLTRNEARRAESELGLLLNPVAKLDEPLMPLNMRSVNDPPPDLAKPAADEPAEPDADEKPSSSDSTAKAISELALAVARQPAPTTIVESPIVNVNNVKEAPARGLEFVFDADMNIIGARPEPLAEVEDA